MANVLGVGIATLDIINFVEEYPEENSEVRASTQVIKRGGNATNTLCVLSQLGHACHWSGVICDNDSSTLIKSDLVKHNIRYKQSTKRSNGGMPTSYISLSKKTGSRTIVHYRDLPELDFEFFHHLDLNIFDWFHFEGRNVQNTSKMLAHCKKTYPRIPVSIEIEKPREGIETVYDSADIIIFSRVFAVSQGFNSAIEFLEHQAKNIRDKQLICVWGEEGAFALVSGQIFKSHALIINDVIDTIGAGDAFNAALIHARIRNLTWQATLDFANKLAGKKCMQIGFDNLTRHI